MREDIRAGLAHVLSDVPVRSGYVEASAGLSRLGGPFARVESGYRPASQFGLFAYGEWTPRDSGAGVGARFTF